jgi:hypothetical protein
VNWAVIACIAGGSLAVVYLRPWRFWWPRRRCPQCGCLLPRWNLWGWQEEWACPRCGCLVGKWAAGRKKGE